VQIVFFGHAAGVPFSEKLLGINNYWENFKPVTEMQDVGIDRGSTILIIQVCNDVISPYNLL